MNCSPNNLGVYIPGGPPKRNSRYSRFFRTCWLEHPFFIIITPRSSNLVENCLFMSNFLWTVISGFARFPEFRGTINDSFSSTCANTYQHSTSYKEISVPMTCLDCKSLLGNTKELQTQAPWQHTDH